MDEDQMSVVSYKLIMIKVHFLVWNDPYRRAAKRGGDGDRKGKQPGTLAPNKVTHIKDYFESHADVLKRNIPTVIGGDFNSIEDIFLDKN